MGSAGCTGRLWAGESAWEQCCWLFDGAVVMIAGVYHDQASGLLTGKYYLSLPLLA